jgi:GNAT superfamily N-acetyltransferase
LPQSDRAREHWLIASDVHIRHAETADIETLVALQRDASVAALAHIFPPEQHAFPIDAVRERWDAILSDVTADALVAVRSGHPVGVAAIRPGWLDALYVLPRSWGTGVAARLHDAAVSGLRERGSHRADLWVLEENRRARAFYERHGWLLNGRDRVVPFPPRPLDVGYTFDLAASSSRRRTRI